MKKLKYLITLLFASMPLMVANAATYVKCGKIEQLPKKVLQLSNTIVNIMQIFHIYLINYLPKYWMSAREN